MQFDAFLSYSRHDEANASRLQRVIESYRPPRDAKRKVAALRVFRDRTDLPAGPRLISALEDRLDSSEFLILLGSPASAESAIVKTEIDYFERQHGKDHILLALSSGSPEVAFPSRFFVDATDPAIYVDLRPPLGERRLSDRTLKERIMPLMAQLLGLELDDLLRRRAQEMGRRKRRIFLASTIGVIAVVFAVVTSGLRTEVGSTVAFRDSDLTYAGVSCVGFAPEGSYAAFGGNGGVAADWNVTREVHPDTLRRLGSIRDIAIEMSRRSVVVTTNDLLVELDRDHEGNVRRRVIFDQQVHALHQLPGVNRWLVGGPDGFIARVDLESEAIEQTWRPVTGDIDAVWACYSDDSEFPYLFHERSRGIFELQPQTGETRIFQGTESTSPVPPLIDVHSLKAVICHPDRVSLVDLRAGTTLSEIHLESDYPPYCLARWRDCVLVGMADGRLELFSLPSGTKLLPAGLSVPGLPASAAFSASGTLLLVGYQDHVASSAGGITLFQRRQMLWNVPLLERPFWPW